MRATSFRFETLIVLVTLAVASIAGAGVAPTLPTYHWKWPTAAGPAHIAFDSQGNSYVTCYDAHRVRKYDTLGNLLLEWGSFGTGNGQFNGPWGIAIDAADIVYVTDWGNNRIQKFTTAGAYVSQWGSSLPGPGQISGPEAITLDAAGNVYITGYTNNRVQKFTNTGGFLFESGSGGSGPGEFNAPEGIHVAANGTIYVVDAGNHRVQYFDVNGYYLGQWGTQGSGNGQFQTPQGIAGDGLGNLYVSEWAGNRVQKFTATGTYVGHWGSTGGGNGQFSNAVGIALDAAGNVHVADYTNARVQRFNVVGDPFMHTPLSAFLMYGPFITGGPANLNDSWHMATDAANNLYVAQAGGHRVFKFSSTGTYLSSIGTGVVGAGNGVFNAPIGVAVDAADNVYVTDLLNHRVQKFNSAGAYLGQWGSLGSGPGQFNRPYGIFVDAAANVWVCDGFNSRIQKFNTSGGFISSWPTAGTPFDLDIGPDGNVYVQTVGTTAVHTQAGTLLRSWSELSHSIEVDADGFVHAVGTSGITSTYSKHTNLGVLVATMGPDMGPGVPPLTNASGIHIDRVGYFYIADDNVIRRLADPPLITRIADIANDQGRSVKLRFRRASGEAASTGPSVYAYAVHRRIEPLPASASASAVTNLARPVAGPSASQITGWDFVGFMGATGASHYEITVPTLANANASSRYYSGFMVQAVTTNSLVNFESVSEGGRSIDNIAPPMVSPFTGALVSGSKHLHWGVSSAPDYSGYRLYKGPGGFVPGPGSLVTATTDTGYVDSGPTASHYVLTAVDFDGNESLPASLALAQMVDVPDGGAPLAFALEGARPSPARAGRLNIRFTLPVASPARLEMFDVAGRRVASRDVGTLGAGLHSVNLSESRGARIQAGLYFLRLSQGAEVRQARVTVLE